MELLIEESGKTYGNACEDYHMLPDCLRYYIAEARAAKDEIIPDYDNKHINMIIKKTFGCSCWLSGMEFSTSECGI